MLVKTDRYNITDKYDVDEILKELNSQNCDYLSDEDFYPPSDNRYLQSYVIDINGGNNFADFCKEFFEVLDEEEYYN